MGTRAGLFERKKMKKRPKEEAARFSLRTGRVCLQAKAVTTLSRGSKALFDHGRSRFERTRFVKCTLPFWDFGRVSLITEIDHGDSNRRLFFCGPGAGRHIGALYVQVEMSGCRSSRERGHHCCALLSVGPDTTTAAAAAPALLWFWRQTWIFHSS